MDTYYHEIMHEPNSDNLHNPSHIIPEVKEGYVTVRWSSAFQHVLVYKTRKGSSKFSYIAEYAL